MNPHLLLRLYPHASKSTLAANAADYGSSHYTGPGAVVERVARDESLEPVKAQKGHPERIHLRVVSVRKRLLDPDNLSFKWLIDCLRYSRIIPGDEPDKITLESSQRKSAKGEEEHTEVTITIPS